MRATPCRPPEPLVPFPRLPEAARAAFPAGELALRPFAVYESDLGVDFDGTPRPILVTELLACCTTDAAGQAVDPALLWTLPVSKRIEALLALVLSSPGAELQLSFRCANAACGEWSEIGLSLAEIRQLQDDAYAADRIAVRIDGGVIELRRPTGSDQLAWLRGALADETPAVAMIRTLQVGGGAVAREGLDARCIDAVEEAMEEHDPLVGFSLLVRCPACEACSPVAIDLQDVALRRLREEQVRLLASVHRIAEHYHWSEQQIFAVPHWRRARYLSLIEREEHA